MLIPVSLPQLSALAQALQLVYQADPTTQLDTHLFGEVPMAGDIHEDLVTHFLHKHGLDEATAEEAASSARVEGLYVRVPATPEVLRVLTRGTLLLTPQDDMVARLSTGELVSVGPWEQTRVGARDLENLHLGGADTLQDFAQIAGA